jgi:hypothetical protein
MKKWLLLLMLMQSFSLFAQSSNSSQSSNEKKIIALLDKQSACWNKGDIEGFMEGYWKNDSLQFIGKSGITYGWNNTLANYKKGYPNTDAMGKLQFTIINVKKLSARWYQVVGKWHLTRTIGNVGGHFTLLLKKIKGQWVIVADHSS